MISDQSLETMLTDDWLMGTVVIGVISDWSLQNNSDQCLVIGKIRYQCLVDGNSTDWELVVGNSSDESLGTVVMVIGCWD